MLTAGHHNRVHTKQIVKGQHLPRRLRKRERKLHCKPHRLCRSGSKLSALRGA